MFPEVTALDVQLRPVSHPRNPHGPGPAALGSVARGRWLRGTLHSPPPLGDWKWARPNKAAVARQRPRSVCGGRGGGRPGRTPAVGRCAVGGRRPLRGGCVGSANLTASPGAGGGGVWVEEQGTWARGGP